MLPLETNHCGRIGLSLLILWSECFVSSFGGSVNTPSTSSNGRTKFPDDGSVSKFSEGSAPIPPPPYNQDSQGNFVDSSSLAEEGNAPTGLEILVAIFFFVAAAWLLIAVFYALLALIVLRLRARGRLDIYDEDFGRFYLFGTRIYIPFGCILRRYVVAFGHDHPNRRNRTTDYRYISRNERRNAIEKILLVDGNHHGNKSRYHHLQSKTAAAQKSDDEEVGGDSQNSNSDNTPFASEEGLSMMPDNTGKPNDTLEKPEDILSDKSPSHSSEELVCSICLAEYDDDDNVFESNVCDHMYHSSCILDWLERRSNTECPCCRQPLVSDDAVWEAVKAARKAKQKRTKRQKKKDSNWFSLARQREELLPHQQPTEAYEDGDERDEESQGMHINHERHGTMSTMSSNLGEQSSNGSATELRLDRDHDPTVNEAGSHAQTNCVGCDEEAATSPIERKRELDAPSDEDIPNDAPCDEDIADFEPTENTTSVRTVETKGTEDEDRLADSRSESD